MNIRNLIAAGAVSFAVIAGIGYAFSQEAEAPTAGCKLGTLVAAQKDFAQNGAPKPEGDKLSGEQMQTLISKVGNPPEADGKPYDLYRFNLEGRSILAVVQGECINDKLGPLKANQMDDLLGITNAKTPAQGERVD